MFGHPILGLLRDGRPHHGYELMTQYRSRSGNSASAGNFYRALGTLTRHGFVKTGINPPDADARRIPYQITEKGAQYFDQWLMAPPNEDEDISTRLLFMDRLPSGAITRLLDRWQEDLWVRGKALGRARESALARQATPGREQRYDPLPALISRRIKQVAAEVEFLQEFRSDFDAWLTRRQQAVCEVSGTGVRDVATKRERGAPRK